MGKKAKKKVEPIKKMRRKRKKKVHVIAKEGIAKFRVIKRFCLIPTISFLIHPELKKSEESNEKLVDGLFFYITIIFFKFSLDFKFRIWKR